MRALINRDVVIAAMAGTEDQSAASQPLVMEPASFVDGCLP